MATSKATRRVCARGHVYYKSSDCPVCPKCRELEIKSYEDSDLPQKLSNPALNALLSAGIIDLKTLSGYTEQQVLQLHGVGKASIPILTEALKKHGLTFKK
jgi:DNA-directed RNA polymerase alpha subunit